MCIYQFFPTGQNLHDMPHRRLSSLLHVTPRPFYSGPTRSLKATNVRLLPTHSPRTPEPQQRLIPPPDAARLSQRSTRAGRTTPFLEPRGSSPLIGHATRQAPAHRRRPRPGPRDPRPDTAPALAVTYPGHLRRIGRWQSLSPTFCHPVFAGIKAGLPCHAPSSLFCSLHRGK